MERAKKIPVGILGATGMVGQQYIALLENHPWFELRYVAASPRSAGKRFGEAVAGRWHATSASDCPEQVKGLVVQDANDVNCAVDALKKGGLSFVFSAVDLPKDEIKTLEEAYAAAGIPVVSNNSAHRWTNDVPVLVPEVNASHCDIIPLQQQNRGWSTVSRPGFIVVKPNCSVQSYVLPVYALIKAGYAVKRMVVTTLQAVSGAGYPGPSSIDLIDNIIPYIPGEEEKSEAEPLKILGSIAGNAIVSAKEPLISAHCNRVPVIDGHSACVSLEFGDKKPELDEIKAIWRDFRGPPQELKLPSAPEQPIIYREEPNRPQPRLDRDSGGGMAVTVGRLRTCGVFDIRFTGLSHNVGRGAAGGGILNAELLKAKGYIA
jgi:aspartate-semialdehyde dehydrogenase